MLSEKERPWKKSKNGSRRFYHTTEIEPADDSIFYVQIATSFGNLLPSQYQTMNRPSQSRDFSGIHVLFLQVHVLMLIGHVLDSCLSLT